MMMISSVWLSMRGCYCCQRPLAVPKRTADVPEVGGGPKLIGFANLGESRRRLTLHRGESHRGFSTCQHLAGPSPIFRRSWRTCSGAQGPDSGIWKLETCAAAWQRWHVTLRSLSSRRGGCRRSGFRRTVGSETSAHGRPSLMAAFSALLHNGSHRERRKR